MLRRVEGGLQAAWPDRKKRKRALSSTLRHGRELGVVVGDAFGDAVGDARERLAETRERLGSLSDEERLQAAWTGFTVASLAFTFLLSRFLPPLTAFFSGPGLYAWAGFRYDANVIFDDTWLTWATDYGIALNCGLWSYSIFMVKKTPATERLRASASGLLGAYALSTFLGAVCHQFLNKSLDTTLFRLVWKLCVGSVALAGGLMGSAGTALAELPKDGRSRPYFDMPVLPHLYWAVFGWFFFAVIYMGLFSMKRPASDIFLTGVSNAPPTIYILLATGSRRSWANVGVGSKTLAVFYGGMLANIALLPGYDFLCFLGLPVGVTNAIMHLVLFTAWGSQGWGLWRFTKGAAKLKPSDE